MTTQRTIERESRQVVAQGIETNGTTAVNAINIPANHEVSEVWIRSALAGVGAANVILGDEDDDNGWILAADHTQVVGTILGDLTADMGVYAITQIEVATTPPVSVDEPVPPKKYTAVKNLQIKLSAAPTTESKWDVYARITPFPSST